jgi:hypothetical protein
MRRWVWGLVVGIALYPIQVQAQGVLERARQAPPSAPISGSPPPSSKSEPSPHPTNSSDSNAFNPFSGDSSDDEALLGWLCLAGLGTFGAAAVAASPFYLPGMLVGDNFTSGGYFPAYPYAPGRAGYQIIDPHWGEAATEDEAGNAGFPRNWALRLSGEDGNDFRGLNRANVRLFVDMKTRLGFMTNWNFLQESDGNGHFDHTTLGDTEMTYRIAQSETLQAFTGLGFRVRTDDINTRWGFNVYYGVDWYPVQPMIVSTSLDIGSIGDQWVFHGRGTVGVAHHHFELFGGYDFMRLGTANLQGPLVGLRFWF